MEILTHLISFSAVPSEILLSLNKPATLSNFWKSTRLATNAFDGKLNQNINSPCAHTDFAEINWIQVDLEATFVISRVEIYNRIDCCWDRLYNVTIDVSFSDDMSNKQQCTSFLLITTESQIESFNCKDSTMGRYVRITQRHNKPEEFHLCEIQVFGWNSTQR